MQYYTKKIIRCKCGKEYWLTPELCGKDHVMYDSFLCQECGEYVSDQPEPTWSKMKEEKNNRVGGGFK